MNGGVAESAKIKKAAHAAGHTERSIRTARTRLKLEISEHGYPRQTWWSLPRHRSAVISHDASVVTVLGESVMNDMTDTIEGSEVSRDGCDSPPRASPQHEAGRPVPEFSSHGAVRWLLTGSPRFDTYASNWICRSS